MGESGLPHGTPSLAATIGKRLECRRAVTAGVNPAYWPRGVIYEKNYE